MDDKEKDIYYHYDKTHPNKLISELCNQLKEENPKHKTYYAKGKIVRTFAGEELEEEDPFEFEAAWETLYPDGAMPGYEAMNEIFKDIAKNVFKEAAKNVIKTERERAVGLLSMILQDLPLEKTRALADAINPDGVIKQ